MCINTIYQRKKELACYSEFLFSHYGINGGVHMVRRLTERKKTKIKDKTYVAKILQSVAKKLLNTKKNINYNDETILYEISNCKSLLENILDEMTYEE